MRGLHQRTSSQSDNIVANPAGSMIACIVLERTALSVGGTIQRSDCRALAFL